MIKILWVFTVFFLPFIAEAQTDNSLYNTNENRLHRYSVHGFSSREKSIGIVPEINFLPNYTVGMGISRANFEAAELWALGYGVNCGFNYSPIDKLAIPYASVWINGPSILLPFYG